MSTELFHLTAAEASRLILSRKLSPVELTQAFLDRIEAVDDRICSYILLLPEDALAAARQAESEIMAGRWRGPLHGIPYAPKDNYFTAGVRTCVGSRLMLDHVPDHDATAVRRMREAGAILLGKLNTWEYGTGTGMVYDDLPFPPARNPWDLACFTGGSSTGAGASVAAGTAMVALGSDTGGSIRLPAAACGLQGIKPTFGLVSRAGVLPNCWSFDAAGPLCWTVEDCAIVLEAIAGHDPDDPTSADRPAADYRRNLHAGVEGLTIGVVRDLGPEGDALDPENAAALEEMARALRALGALIEEVRLPAPLTQYRHVTSVINWAESLSIHEADFMERSQLMGQALRDKMMTGFTVRAVDYLAALRLRRQLAMATDALVRGCDALILPGAFHPAPRFDEPERVGAFTLETATSVFNVTGHPAMSICTGFNAAGLPLNAQMVGNYFDEATLFRVACAYEQATASRDRRPIPAAPLSTASEMELADA